MQHLFLEVLILVLAMLGIFITILQIFYYRTEKKMYYKIIKIKNNTGKTVEIIVSADECDEELEETIKDTVSTYYLKKTN